MLVSILDLWLPILLSAVGVFIVSSLIHMVLGWHNRDYSKLPNEDEMIAAIEAANLEPKTYIFPCAEDPSQNMNSPELMERWKRGPTGMVSVFDTKRLNIGKQLGHWFLYCVVVGVLVSYLAGAFVAPGASFTTVLRFVGTAAFFVYAGSLWHDVIWKCARPTAVAKFIVDGLLYALTTGVVFGWLWP